MSVPLCALLELHLSVLGKYLVGRPSPSFISEPAKWISLWSDEIQSPSIQFF